MGEELSFLRNLTCKMNSLTITDLILFCTKLLRYLVIRMLDFSKMVLKCGLNAYR